MTKMLTSVVSESGTGRLAKLNQPSAAKTGTTQKYRDGWFVGYTSEYVTGVWMGNDDGSNTKGLTGGNLPAKVWRSTMIAAHGNKNSDKAYNQIGNTRTEINSNQLKDSFSEFFSTFLSSDIQD